MPTLVLASASPRRADLLRAAGIAFDVRVSEVDESPHPDESPEEYVRRIAEVKARAVIAAGERRAILSADTVVVNGGRALGKPRDAADARHMLESLSGRTHIVLTAVCVVSDAAEPSSLTRAIVCRVESTTVEFDVLRPHELDWYVASGEPMGKAGAYAIQGLASRFVRRIEGSYSNVVGLPVALVYRMCTEAGILVS
ncbi:MAG TPA: Maf family protein [Vicinamibacterales bacterium]|nr:Maf family protein [Vicinamibacterales bacterium]